MFTEEDLRVLDITFIGNIFKLESHTGRGEDVLLDIVRADCIGVRTG